MLVTKLEQTMNRRDESVRIMTNGKTDSHESIAARTSPSGESLETKNIYKLHGYTEPNLSVDL